MLDAKCANGRLPMRALMGSAPARGSIWTSAATFNWTSLNSTDKWWLTSWPGLTILHWACPILAPVDSHPGLLTGVCQSKAKTQTNGSEPIPWIKTTWTRRSQRASRHASGSSKCYLNSTIIWKKQDGLNIFESIPLTNRIAVI